MATSLYEQARVIPRHLLLQVDQFFLYRTIFSSM